MMRARSIVIAGCLLVAAGAARAQSSEIIGKIADADGKPVEGVEVVVKNDAFAERTYRAKSDKKGSFYIPGLVFEAAAQDWTVSIESDSYVPTKAHTIARGTGKVLYLEDENILSAAKRSFPVKIKAYAEIRIEFTMRPGDPSAEAAAVAPIPSAAPGATPDAPAAPVDSYAAAIETVRAGKLDESVDLFKKAIEEQPDDWERRDVFAKVLLQLDRQGEATLQATKAVQAAPDKAAPLVTLTEVYLVRGLTDKAAEAIGKARALEPDNPKVLERAASVAADSGNLDEAIALNERVLATKPDSVEILVSLADLYNRKKLPKKAEEVLDRVVALDPKNAYRTFYNLGVVIENRDELTEADHRRAVEAFRKSIELKPEYALAHRDLGYAYLRLGNASEARKALQKYVSLDPRARDAAEVNDTIKSLSAVR